MSGSFIYRHHVEPRVKPYSPREESFPIPLKYIDVKELLMRIWMLSKRSALMEHWWLSRLVWSLDGFHTIYSTRRKSSWRIYVVRGEIDKKQLTSKPDHLWPELWEKMGKMPSWRRSKSGRMKSSILITRENCEGSFSSTWRTRNFRRPLRMLARNWKHQWDVSFPIVTIGEASQQGNWVVFGPGCQVMLPGSSGEFLRTCVKGPRCGKVGDTAERRIIPFSTEIHWRIENYKNEFGCYARKPRRWLLVYWWIKRFVWFLDKFHSVYSIRRRLQTDIWGVREVWTS